MSTPKTGLLPLPASELPANHQGGACAQPHRVPSQKTASLLERLSVSKFPWRYPVLYGLIFELRTFYHRIRLLWIRGHIRPLEIGLTFQEASPGYLVRNRRNRFKHLQYTEAVRVYGVATEQEKPLLNHLLREKRQNLIRRHGTIPSDNN
jgi:hypothetical protein